MNSFEEVNIPGKGRGLIATKVIEAGDTIFEEEPFVSCQFSWNVAYGYVACDHCMRPLETTEENVRRLSNIPTYFVPFPEHDPTALWLKQFTNCEHCGVKYCSEDCRREALARYHRVGCMGTARTDETHPINILNEIWKQCHYPPETGTVMVLVRLMFMYQQSNNKEEFLEQLQSFQAIAINEEQQIYHKMLGDNFQKPMEELFIAFHNAFPGDEFKMFTTQEAFKTLLAIIGTNAQGIATSALAGWVKSVTESTFPDADKSSIDKFISDLYENVEKYSGEFLNNEGAGLYTLQSKINHSCVPNAESSFPYSNDICVLTALTSIGIGEEICISYLDKCQLSRGRHSRQKILKDHYIFLCDCLMCKAQADDPEETSEDDDEEMEEGSDMSD